MTASDPRVGEIQADAIEAAAKAFIEYGTILPAIKAAAPYIAAKALEDAADDFGGTYHGNWLRVRAAAVRGEVIARVEALAKYLDGLAAGDKHYAALIRAAVAAANGGSETVRYQDLTDDERAEFRRGQEPTT